MKRLWTPAFQLEISEFNLVPTSFFGDAMYLEALPHSQSILDRTSIPSLPQLPFMQRHLRFGSLLHVECKSGRVSRGKPLGIYIPPWLLEIFLNPRELGAIQNERNTVPSEAHLNLRLTPQGLTFDSGQRRRTTTEPCSDRATSRPSVSTSLLTLHRVG